MDKLVIEGGIPLEGSVRISGAKNSSLPLICASLLTSEILTLSNVPHLKDVTTMLTVLGQIGVNFSLNEKNLISLEARDIKRLNVPYDLVKTMRASVLVLGPMLTRFGEAKVSLPGGCAIGQRPIDQHIKGLEALGAEIKIDSGYIIGKAKKLKGTCFKFDLITVTGTQNLIMAAVLAEGTTLIKNAAIEPEVIDLISCLKSMGARIEVSGLNEIKIDGVKRLKGTEYTVMFDRIEAGTFLLAGAMTNGNLEIRNVVVNNLNSVLEKLQSTGVKIEVKKDIIKISSSHMKSKLKSVDISTNPYPGFPTDMQAQFMAFNSLATGHSVIVENIFENRFMHVQELRRFGAKIEVCGNKAKIYGSSFLQGTKVMATDLRASASLVLAGLVACGKTTIDRVYHLDRGYERIEEKLGLIGANIKRLN